MRHRLDLYEAWDELGKLNEAASSESVFELQNEAAKKLLLESDWHDLSNYAICKKMCGIYAIKSSDDRLYVGQSVDIGRRIWQHQNVDYVRFAEDSPKLHISIKKLGKSNFKFCILDHLTGYDIDKFPKIEITDKSTADELDKANKAASDWMAARKGELNSHEMSWVSELATFNKINYNLTAGGESRDHANLASYAEVMTTLLILYEAINMKKEDQAEFFKGIANNVEEKSSLKSAMTRFSNVTSLKDIADIFTSPSTLYSQWMSEFDMTLISAGKEPESFSIYNEYKKKVGQITKSNIAQTNAIIDKLAELGLAPMTIAKTLCTMILNDNSLLDETKDKDAIIWKLTEPVMREREIDNWSESIANRMRDSLSMSGMKDRAEQLRSEVSKENAYRTMYMRKIGLHGLSRDAKISWVKSVFNRYLSSDDIAVRAAFVQGVCRQTIVDSVAEKIASSGKIPTTDEFRDMIMDALDSRLAKGTPVDKCAFATSVYEPAEKPEADPAKSFDVADIDAEKQASSMNNVFKGKILAKPTSRNESKAEIVFDSYDDIFEPESWSKAGAEAPIFTESSTKRLRQNLNGVYRDKSGNLISAYGYTWSLI